MLNFIGIDDFFEQRHVAEQTGLSRHDELSAGPGHGYVQFPVNGLSVLGDRIGCEEVELIVVAYGEGVDDHIALRPLIALHCVDAHVEQTVNAVWFELLADKSYLVSIGYDDTERCVRVEMVAIESVYATDELSYQCGFLLTGGV